MNIEEMYYSYTEDLSFRSLTVCLNNNLVDLNSVLEYYEKNQTFITLRNCGKKTNSELINICLKYRKNKEFTFEQQNDSSEDLLTIINNLSYEQIEYLNRFISLNFNNLSNRSKNALLEFLNYDLCIEKLKIFFQNENEFNFRSINRIGLNSEIEVRLFIKKISNVISIIDQPNFFFIEDFKRIENLSEDQIRISNKFIELNFNRLSNRSKNALNLFLNKDLSIHNVVNNFLKNHTMKIRSIKSIGIKSELEIENLINSIENFIEEISRPISERDFKFLSARIYLELEFSEKVIPNKLFDSKNAFSLIQFIVKNEFVFEGSENIIFQNSLKVFETSEKYGKKEIADELHISSERVRQIGMKIVRNLSFKFNFIIYLKEFLFDKYFSNGTHDFIFIDYNLACQINNENNTIFTKEFISFIISHSASLSFRILGDSESVLLKKINNSNKKHNWNNFYLINSNLFNFFDFDSFIKDLNLRITFKSRKVNWLNFDTYIMQFINKHDESLYLVICPIVETLIFEEFNLIISNGMIRY
uniref:hypothetical protein n=1 Tax=Algoriphagus sp. TaxID=1872435 RepID=UPI0040476B25